MKRFLLLIFSLVYSYFLYSQQFSEETINKHADDFTITTTDGVTRNLYNTLDSGKTVFIDLFYTTCSWCQYYSPIIEEIYQNTGAGSGDIEFWGISNNLFDTNNVIDQYKLNYNITNPCAGPWGGGTTAFSIIVNGQNFTGFPTYCVICPDRTLYFDPCYPPTENGFDPYFASCDTLTGISDDETALKGGIISVYPNPADNELSFEVFIDQPGSIDLEFYNILSLNVLTVNFDLTAAKQTLHVNTGDLSNGVYMVKMMKNSRTLGSIKVCISR